MTHDQETYDLVIQSLLSSVADAGGAGITRALLGASPDAIRILRKGKKMGKPFIDFHITITKADKSEVHRTIPVFCDPGLTGLKVYAIAWPMPADNNDIPITVS